MDALPTTTVASQGLQPTTYAGAGNLGTAQPLAAPIQTVSALPTTIATNRTFTYTLPSMPPSIPTVPTVPTGTYAPYAMPMQGSQPLAMPRPTVLMQPQVPQVAPAPVPQSSPESASIGGNLVPSMASPVSTSTFTASQTNTPVTGGMPQPASASPSAVATQSFVLTGPPTATGQPIGSPVQTGVPMVPMQSMGSQQGKVAVDPFGVQAMGTNAAVTAAGASEGDEATVQTQSLKQPASRKNKKARRRWFICC